MELHTVTEILNELHRIFYILLKGVLLSPVDYNRRDSSYWTPAFDRQINGMVVYMLVRDLVDICTAFTFH